MACAVMAGARLRHEAGAACHPQPAGPCSAGRGRLTAGVEEPPAAKWGGCEGAQTPEWSWDDRGRVSPVLWALLQPVSPAGPRGPRALPSSPGAWFRTPETGTEPSHHPAWVGPAEGQRPGCQVGPPGSAPESPGAEGGRAWGSTAPWSGVPRGLLTIVTVTVPGARPCAARPTGWVSVKDS